jgi:hypothetical protein
MATSSIKFRFANARDSDAVLFEGQQILASVLRRAIAEKRDLVQLGPDGIALFDEQGNGACARARAPRSARELAPRTPAHAVPQRMQELMRPPPRSPPRSPPRLTAPPTLTLRRDRRRGLRAQEQHRRGAHARGALGGHHGGGRGRAARRLRQPRPRR